LALWLVGARSVTTVDINQYLKEELVQEDLDYIRIHRDEVEQLFGGRIHDGRLDRLLEFAARPWRLDGLLALCDIEYMAPASAAALRLSPLTIDCHISSEVFEHISPDILRDIIEEGKRTLKKDGLFIHRIDYSDHFAHSDGSISPINCLQFTDHQWSRIAGNRYMYMNRLRCDDFGRLFEEAGLRMLTAEHDEDPAVLEQLRHGDIKLNQAFAGKSDKVLCTTASWMVLRLDG
jgi:hypothetical protein